MLQRLDRLPQATGAQICNPEDQVPKGEAGTEADGALSGSNGGFVLAAKDMGHGHGIMRVGVLLIKLDGPQAGFHPAPQTGLGIAPPSVSGKTGFDPRQPDVPIGRVRLGLDCLQEQLAGAVVRVGPDLVELPHAPPDEIPGGQAPGALGPALPLLPEEFGLDGSRDLLCYLILEHQDIADVAVIALSPDGAAGLRLGELGRDADVGAAPAHAATEDVANAQATGDLLCLDGFALEREGGTAGCDEQPAGFRQGRDDVVRDAISEVLLARGRRSGWRMGERQWKVYRSGFGSAGRPSARGARCPRLSRHRRGSAVRCS